MRTGRPTVAIVLTEAEQQHLTVARRVRVSPATVGRWRTRFARDRVDGLLDEPRPGTPRTVTDAQVEQVVITTLETTPAGATHWSTRSLARATGLSRMTVSRIWRAFGLRPHRSETFKLASLASLGARSTSHRDPNLYHEPLGQDTSGHALRG